MFAPLATNAAAPRRVDALRGLIIFASWMIAAQLTTQWFRIGSLPFSIIWPANGIAYGFVAAYGAAAVPPAALSVLVWNLLIQHAPLMGSLLGTASFSLSMLLAAWALRRLRSAPNDDRTAVRDALQYYGILIGLCVSLDTVLGFIQYRHTAAWAAMPQYELLLIYWFSDVFGVLFFTRLTELAVRGAESGWRKIPPPAAMGAALWLLVWGLLVLLGAWLIQIGELDNASLLRYLSFLLLAILMFRFSAGFSYLGLMLTGMAQVALAEQMLGHGVDQLPRWADQSVLVSVFCVFGLLGIAAIAQQRWAQRQMARLAHEDLLTGLLNDRGYARAIESAEPRPSTHFLGVEILQLDAIEELVGPQHKQDVERAVGHLLEEVCGAKCSLARTHDGYFSLMAPTLEKARQVAEDVWKTLDGRRFQFDDQTVWLHVAVGAVPLRPELGATEQMALLTLATQVAGDRFDHRIHFAHDEGESLIEARRAQRRLLSLMEAALRAEPWDDAQSHEGSVCGFQLYAQPIVDLHGASEVSFEVLLRWRVDGELQSPAAFLPLAERHGLMPAIDRWVLRHSLRQLNAHPAALARLGKVSINLSGTSLSDAQLLDDLRRTVLDSGIPTEKLCFEITETAAIHRPEQALALLRGLRAMGAAVSLDDFGTGLASFAYLKTFPFDQLKIDGLFIRDLAGSKQDQTMVAAICTVARSMGLRTVAEFVEDAATIDILRKDGVDAVQGYGVGRPQPLRSALAELSQPSDLQAAYPFLKEPG